jgi:hypothetical protein
MDIKWRNEVKFMNKEIGRTKRKSTKKKEENQSRTFEHGDK